MPVSVSYPGVYLEEIPSGVRSITGVATAIAAFVGRTRRGPTDEAKRVSSWAEFEREYGGLWKESPVSYAVSHYFTNGGAEAVIARVHNGEGDEAGLIYPDAEVLALRSTTGENYRLVISHDADPAKPLDFSIEVQPEGGGAAIETFELSLDPTSGDHVALVIGEGMGEIIELADEDDLPMYRPDEGTVDMAAGTSATPSVTATCSLPTAGDPLVLTALVEGEAGNTLSATVSDVTATGFTLTVTDSADPGSAETWIVTDYATGGGAAFIANVANNSELFGVTTPAAFDLPTAGTTAFVGGAGAGEATEGGASLTCTRPAGAPASTIAASSPGTWGNNLLFSVNYDTKDSDDDTLFNLVIIEVDPDDASVELRRETFRNLSTDEGSARYAETVVNQESNLVRLELGGTGRPAACAFTSLVGGEDGLELTNTLIPDGLDLLEKVDLFTILCIPPLTLVDDSSSDIDDAVRAEAIALCDKRNAFFVVDPPADWTDKDDALTGVDALNFRERNAAVYFPRLKMPDPLKENRLGTFAPCGVVAGLFARTDASRGVWKAPAGLEANVRGVRALTVKLTDAEQGQLNQVGVNCIRTFPVVGTVIWGARTLRGADVLADDWKYVPVRRLANYLRESLYRGTQWAVFEPNDEPLWAQLRLSIGSFMQTLFQQGAFQGKTAREAYFVKCDKETTTQADINLGIVNILVGFAPLKPAEFVIIKLQQMAGQSG